MKQPHVRRLRDRRLDRSRRIAQSLFVTAAASSGVGIGLIAHASATTQSTTTTTVPSGGSTTTTPSTPSTTTTVPSGHPTTTRPGTHSTTTVWVPPTTVPVTVTTTCHTSASGQFLGCW